MILMTGHAGYIGSHCFDPDTMMGCDLREGSDFGEEIGHHFDTVIHLAALVSVIDSLSRPDAYFEENTFKISRFLRNNQVDRFVFTSTGGAMYGNTYLAQEEDAKWGLCQSPYAQSKYLGEAVVREFCPNHCILRLANVFGGDDSNRGEAACHAHFSSDNPIVVYGGNQVRDFVHIDVVRHAILAAVKGGMVGTFNIGAGEPTNILDIAKSFGATRNVPVVIKPERDEIKYITLDPSRAIEAGLILQ